MSEVGTSTANEIRVTLAASGAMSDELLHPIGTHPFSLPSGPVSVPKSAPSFKAWSRQPPADTYNGKPLIDYSGRLAFAELAILWTMMEQGWDGVWIDSYRKLFRTGYWDCEPVPSLPPRQAELLERIYEKAGFRSGAWDVFCWRGDEVMFLESKRAGKDHIRESQTRFLQAALEVGLFLESFLVVEWTLALP